MTHPHWEAAKRYLSYGKGGLRHFPEVLSTPIMQSLPLLSVVLASRPTQFVSVFKRAAGTTPYTTESPRHTDEQLVRTGLLDMHVRRGGDVC